MIHSFIFFHLYKVVFSKIRTYNQHSKTLNVQFHFNYLNYFTKLQHNIPNSQVRTRRLIRISKKRKKTVTLFLDTFKAYAYVKERDVLETLKTWVYRKNVPLHRKLFSRQIF